MTVTLKPSYHLNRLDWPQRRFIDLTGEPCPMAELMREAEKGVKP